MIGVVSFHSRQRNGCSSHARFTRSSYPHQTLPFHTPRRTDPSSNASSTIVYAGGGAATESHSGSSVNSGMVRPPKHSPSPDLETETEFESWCRHIPTLLTRVRFSPRDHTNEDERSIGSSTRVATSMNEWMLSRTAS